MPVAVVDVRHVGMCVGQREMHVSVRVRLSVELGFLMPVPVMLIVNMSMLMLEQLVHMPVLVDLGEEQEDPERHEAAGRDLP